MMMTPDLQKKVATVGGFVLLAGGILYFQLRDDSPTPVAAPPTVQTIPSAGPAAKTGAVISVPPGHAVGAAAKNLGTTAAQLDPTLHMEAMLVTESLVYSGSGRNIFSPNSAPVVPVGIPKAIASARPKGAMAPMAQMPQGPPPPPPIDLKFFGTATAANGQRRAFLLKGEDVFLASDGDIVQRRYKVVTVSANSIVVEDMANNNRQTLPLISH